MRILIYSKNYQPENIGIGKYTGEMVQWLAAMGHELRVVAAPPHYPQWRVADGYANGWYRERWQSGSGGTEAFLSPVVIYRCPLWVPAKPSGLKRVLHLVSFALSSFPVMISQILWRPDVVLVVEPPLFCAPQAWLVARLSGGKACMHIQDYEVDAAFDLGLLKGSVLRHIVAASERWLMRRFDLVSTISQRMIDRALTKGVDPERVVLFPNWVEIKQEQGARCKGQGDYRAELGIAAESVVALYSGNMGGKQGLEILAQVARIVASRKVQGACRPEVNAGTEPCSLILAPDVAFVFCGNGSGRADLVSLCDDLPNVRFMDLQPMERLGELLAMADIHLLPQRADAADLVMPSKLTGMLASARPVVATAHEGTELANVVATCGIVVEPELPQSFADAIIKLSRDAELRTSLGVAGRAYAVANLDRDMLLGRFEAELMRLVSAG